jgi:uncharacterized coiled-coil protein SlyX
LLLELELLLQKVFLTELDELLINNQKNGSRYLNCLVTILRRFQGYQKTANSEMLST